MTANGNEIEHALIVRNPNGNSFQVFTIRKFIVHNFLINGGSERSQTFPPFRTAGGGKASFLNHSRPTIIH